MRVDFWMIAKIQTDYLNGTNLYTDFFNFLYRLIIHDLPKKIPIIQAKGSKTIKNITKVNVSDSQYVQSSHP